MRNYGLPYMGSKSRIAEWLVGQLPSCDCFVDVFCGGCAVTHAMIMAGKAKRYIVNDIQKDVPDLFVKALNGELSEDKRWISREDFFKLKDFDPLVRLCWSFGNDGITYLYGREIEPYKKAVHAAIVSDSWDSFEAMCPDVAPAVKRYVQVEKSTNDRRLVFQAALALECKRLTRDNWNNPLIQGNPLYKSIKTKTPKTCRMNNVDGICNQQLLLPHSCFRSSESIERLKRIEGFNLMQCMQQTDRVTNIERVELHKIDVFGVDYSELQIPLGAVVFCDPPYAESKVTYNKTSFDNSTFIDWCIKTAKTNDVYVTEYNINNPHFILIGEKKRQISMNGTGSKGMKAERIYKVIPFFN